MKSSSLFTSLHLHQTLPLLNLISNPKSPKSHKPFKSLTQSVCSPNGSPIPSPPASQKIPTHAATKPPQRAVSPILPAKKRKETREQPILPDPTPAAFAVNTYSLPAKKSIWALPPDLDLLEKPVSELGLNLEYKPEADAAVEEVEECTESVCENASEKGSEDSGGEEECEGEDEDGVVCNVCKSTDGDPSDPIVFCDGWDLMVHASCYGNPLVKGIPEGDWFCSQCSELPKASGGIGLFPSSSMKEEFIVHRRNKPGGEEDTEVNRGLELELG